MGFCMIPKRFRRHLLRILGSASGVHVIEASMVFSRHGVFCAALSMSEVTLTADCTLESLQCYAVNRVSHPASRKWHQRRLLRHHRHRRYRRFRRNRCHGGRHGRLQYLVIAPTIAAALDEFLFSCYSGYPFERHTETNSHVFLYISCESEIWMDRTNNGECSGQYQNGGCEGEINQRVTRGKSPRLEILLEV